MGRELLSHTLETDYVACSRVDLEPKCLAILQNPGSSHRQKAFNFPNILSLSSDEPDLAELDLDSLARVLRLKIASGSKLRGRGIINPDIIAHIETIRLPTYRN